MKQQRVPVVVILKQAPAMKLAYGAVPPWWAEAAARESRRGASVLD
jgi:hypothetical protein